MTWYMILFMYLSVGCGAVVWAGVIDALDKDHAQRYDAYANIFTLIMSHIFLVIFWPGMIHFLIGASKETALVMGPPRCLECGSLRVRQLVELTPPQRRLLEGSKDKDSYHSTPLGYRKTQTYEYDYAVFEGEKLNADTFTVSRRHYRDNWGRCDDCNTDLDRKRMEELWSSE